MVSASVKSSHGERAFLAPAITALFFPVQLLATISMGRTFGEMTRTPGKPSAISRVRSVEASSTTVISKVTPVWVVSDSRQARRLDSSFRAGMIIETSGQRYAGTGVRMADRGLTILRRGSSGGSEENGSEGRIAFRYYSGVRRMLLPKPLVTILAIGLLAALIGCYGSAHPARIGSNAPDFTLQDSDHTVTLSQFRGQVVLLNFWATWCPPCIEETPSLVRMQDRLKEKGVTVLAVSIDADDAAYHKFLKEYNINMVTVRAEPQKAARLYGTFGWPETYVIDRQGVIRRKFIGAVDWNSPEVTDFLSRSEEHTS